MGGTTVYPIGYKFKPLVMEEKPTKLDLKAKEIAVKLVRRDYNSALSRRGVIERESARLISASYWNVWINGGWADKMIKNGGVVTESEITKFLHQNAPFDSRERGRQDVETFFNERGYQLAYTIVHDDLGTFWVGKPGESSMTVIKSLRHV